MAVPQLTYIAGGLFIFLLSHMVIMGAFLQHSAAAVFAEGCITRWTRLAGPRNISWQLGLGRGTPEGLCKLCQSSPGSVDPSPIQPDAATGDERLRCDNNSTEFGPGRPRARGDPVVPCSSPTTPCSFSGKMEQVWPGEKLLANGSENFLCLLQRNFSLVEAGRAWNFLFILPLLRLTRTSVSRPLKNSSWPVQCSWLLAPA